MAVIDIEKDPNSKLDWCFNWAEWLNGDTIADSSWTIPTGLTKELESFDTTCATIWLSGGDMGSSYEVTNHIVTAAGREEDRSMIIIMRQR